MPPLVFVLQFKVCSMVWSTGSCEKPWEVVCTPTLTACCKHGGAYLEALTCELGTLVNTVHYWCGHVQKTTEAQF